MVPVSAEGSIWSSQRGLVIPLQPCSRFVALTFGTITDTRATGSAGPSLPSLQFFTCLPSGHRLRVCSPGDEGSLWLRILESLWDLGDLGEAPLSCASGALPLQYNPSCLTQLPITAAPAQHCESLSPISHSPISALGALAHF